MLSLLKRVVSFAKNNRHLVSKNNPCYHDVSCKKHCPKSGMISYEINICQDCGHYSSMKTNNVCPLCHPCYIPISQKQLSCADFYPRDHPHTKWQTEEELRNEVAEILSTVCASSNTSKNLPPDGTLSMPTSKEGAPCTPELTSVSSKSPTPTYSAVVHPAPEPPIETAPTPESQVNLKTTSSQNTHDQSPTCSTNATDVNTQTMLTPQVQPIASTPQVQPVTSTSQVQPVSSTSQVQPIATTLQAQPTTLSSQTNPTTCIGKESSSSTFKEVIFRKAQIPYSEQAVNTQANSTYNQPQFQYQSPTYVYGNTEEPSAKETKSCKKKGWLDFSKNDSCEPKTQKKEFDGFPSIQHLVKENLMKSKAASAFLKPVRLYPPIKPPLQQEITKPPRKARCLENTKLPRDYNVPKTKLNYSNPRPHLAGSAPKRYYSSLPKLTVSKYASLNDNTTKTMPLNLHPNRRCLSDFSHKNKQIRYSKFSRDKVHVLPTSYLKLFSRSITTKPPSHIEGLENSQNHNILNPTMTFTSSRQTQESQPINKKCYAIEYARYYNSIFTYEQSSSNISQTQDLSSFTRTRSVVKPWIAQFLKPVYHKDISFDIFPRPNDKAEACFCKSNIRNIIDDDTFFETDREPNANMPYSSKDKNPTEHGNTRGDYGHAIYQRFPFISHQPTRSYTTICTGSCDKPPWPPKAPVCEKKATVAKSNEPIITKAFLDMCKRKCQELQYTLKTGQPPPTCKSCMPCCCPPPNTDYVKKLGLRNIRKCNPNSRILNSPREQAHMTVRVPDVVTMIPTCDSGGYQNIPPNPCCHVPGEQPNSRKYKLLAAVVFFPLIILQMLNIIQAGGFDGHKKHGPCCEYEYMRRRTKRFPWRNGDTSLFHNPNANYLPAECLPVCETKKCVKNPEQRKEEEEKLEEKPKSKMLCIPKQ